MADDNSHDPKMSDNPAAEPAPSLRYGLFGGSLAVERLLAQVIPAEDGEASFAVDERVANARRGPDFSLGAMSLNLRRFNARAGVLFLLQDELESLLEWQRPNRTLALLAVHTLVCLDPEHLLPALPPLLLVLAVLAPGFANRHPAPPPGTLSSEQDVGYSPSSPPPHSSAANTHSAPASAPARDFAKNMRRLQNQMGAFVRAHDAVVDHLLPLANFSDEARSSAVLLAALAAAALALAAAHLIPWRLLILLAGWAHVCAAHPYAVQFAADLRAGKVFPVPVPVPVPDSSSSSSSLNIIDRWIASDILLDAAPETREVEIFELQRKSPSGVWEAWVFCPTPYDPASAARVAGRRPAGTRFFEDVAPPPGWEWSEKKWALDLWSREWVEERIITSVEVETEGEHWVYDMYDHHDGGGDDASWQSPLVERPPPTDSKTMNLTSWTEAEDGLGLKGAWRRRRWVRLVKRKVCH